MSMRMNPRTCAELWADPAFWIGALEFGALDAEDPADYGWSVFFENCTLPGYMPLLGVGL